MSSTSLRVLLVVLALALSSACATTSAASSVTKTSTHSHAKKHRASSSGSSVARSPSAASRALDDEIDVDGDDGVPDQSDAAIIVNEGGASFYHDSLAGRVTANGEKYDPDAQTCAHRSLPFGTILVVEDVTTGKKTQCRVNDRGPFVDGRLIDVSRKVARELNMIERGVIKVRIRVAKLPTTT